MQNLKDQILTTNVWLEHVSHRSRLYIESPGEASFNHSRRIAGMAGSQVSVGSGRVRRCHRTLRTQRAHMASRHCALQQVRTSILFKSNKIFPFPSNSFFRIMKLENWFQRGWGVRGYHDDQSYPTLHGQGTVDTSGDFQILVRDRRPIFPIRSANLLHEVRLVDLRRYSGKRKKRKKETSFL